jgi:curved DNA-binding protein CbpA
VKTTVADHYTVLGVKRGSDRAAIRAAYRSLARQTHPDHGGDEDYMARINEAWRVLGDPARRAEYDGPTAAVPPSPRARRSDSTVLDFGRYAGWSIRDIANSDEDYLHWFARTPLGRPLRHEISQVLEERARAFEALRPAPAKPSGRGRRLWGSR